MSRATDGFSAMTRVFTRRSVAKGWNAAAVARVILRGRELAAVSLHRRGYGWADPAAFSLEEQGGRASPTRRWLRPLCQSHVQSRPVAARSSALSGPSASLHGEVRLVRASAELDPRQRRRLSGAARYGRRGGDAARSRARRGRRGGRDLPGGHAAQQGTKEQVAPVEARIGCRPGGAHRRRPASPRRDRRHREPDEARAPPSRIWGAGRARRRQGAGHPQRLEDRHRAADGGNPRAGEDVMSQPLLVVDGDSLAHRAYHAMPKTVNRGGIVGFTNMLVRLWEQEQPRAVVVGWDTLTEPTYRHEAFEA